MGLHGPIDCASCLPAALCGPIESVQRSKMSPAATTGLPTLPTLHAPPQAVAYARAPHSHRARALLGMLVLLVVCAAAVTHLQGGSARPTARVARYARETEDGTEAEQADYAGFGTLQGVAGNSAEVEQTVGEGQYADDGEEALPLVLQRPRKRQRPSSKSGGAVNAFQEYLQERHRQKVHREQRQLVLPAGQAAGDSGESHHEADVEVVRTSEEEEVQTDVPTLTLPHTLHMETQ